MHDVVIVAAKRTPIGAFQGCFADVSAPKLGACAIRAAVADSAVKLESIDEVILGNVLTSMEGQAPARQALLEAGLPKETSALTIGKVCGSGLKAVMLAEQILRLGDAKVIVAGGMENMSRVPYAIEKARSGLRLGDAQITDLMIRDGLWDPYNNCHMGNIGEKCAAKYGITREQQDQFAAVSYQRAQQALQSGRFKDEIAPVSIPQRKGDPKIFDTDEEPSRGDVAKLSSLRAAFDASGTITAGNASSLNDGAAALVLMTSEEATLQKLKPLVRIVAHAEISQEPDWFTTAPAIAMQKALAKAKLAVSDIDLWEINEAFAVVSLYNNNALELPLDRVNVNGGAVALGHPIGASGARILVSLIHELLKRPSAKRGMASLCIGGGEAVAMIVEKI